MMPKCHYVAVPAKVPGLYDLTMTVHPGNEVHPLDVGTIKLIAVSKERCQEEHDAMRALGYEMVSEIREALKFFGI